jgi:ubiquinone/menaquinone biosynthesis C-methylase UbiE
MHEYNFDRWAHSYETSALQPVFQAAHAAVVARARNHLGQPRRILDVGCGTGRLLRIAGLVFPGSVCVGVDVSGGMLTVATARGRRFACAQAAAERLPFVSQAFDLILSTASFRHWADSVAATREIHRVLAPGGVFVLADLFSRHKRSLRARLTGCGVLHPTVAATLSEAGLRTVSEESVGGYGPIPAITVVVAGRRSRVGVG